MITQDRLSSSQNGQARSSVGRGLGALLHDSIALIELQGKLFVHDLHQVRTSSGPALLMMALGVILAFATVPVLLLGLGWMLASFSGWPVWVSVIAVAFIGGVGPAIGLLVLGWKTIMKKAGLLSRSTSELRMNAEWLKRRLKSSL